MDLVIKNGTIVTSTDMFVSDIGVEKGRIVAIEGGLSGADQTIDATGRYVIPGAVDAHVHFQLPTAGAVSCDTFETGTKAAAAGGTTTVIDFAMQREGEDLVDSIERRMGEANGNVCIDYALHAELNYPLSDSEWLKKAVSAGVTSFKVYMMRNSPGWEVNEAALTRVLDESRSAGGTVMVHAEAPDIIRPLIEQYHTEDGMREHGAYCHALTRPHVSEETAVQTALQCVQEASGSLYITHISASLVISMIKEVKERGFDVHGETCPHYLLMNDDMLKGPEGHMYATTPQLRTPGDQRFLWLALASGDIEVVSTDNCAFKREQKDAWEGDFTKIPYGLPGVETLLPLMHSEAVAGGLLGWNRLVNLVSTNPSRIFGLYGRKGDIDVGFDADLVVFDPRKRLTISHQELETDCDWSPYEGLEVEGWSSVTISRGNVVAKDGRFVGKKGHGQFLEREPKEVW